MTSAPGRGDGPATLVGRDAAYGASVSDGVAVEEGDPEAGVEALALPLPLALPLLLELPSPSPPMLRTEAPSSLAPQAVNAKVKGRIIRVARCRGRIGSARWSGSEVYVGS